MNRYIKAMEIGLANEKEGISYFEIIAQIEKSLGYEMDFVAEKTFFLWFKDNFRTTDSDSYFKNKEYMFHRMKSHQDGGGVSDDQVPYVEDFIGVLNLKFFLNGQAAKQYLDYQELQESRIAATQARRQSNISIWIAIGAIVISTILGAYSIFSSPRPPFDVKIIKNRIRKNKTFSTYHLPLTTYHLPLTTYHVASINRIYKP